MRGIAARAAAALHARGPGVGAVPRIGLGVMRFRAVPATASNAAALQLWRWLTVWLLLALVAAPLLARMHQVVHMPQLGAGAPPAVTAAWQPSSVTELSGDAAPQSLAPAVQALFAHHGSLDCQALDQLAHGQAPFFHLLWLPLSWAAAQPLTATLQLQSSLRWWAPLARGPPALHFPSVF